MVKMASDCHNIGQDRDLGGAQIPFKSRIWSKIIFRFWRVIVSWWLQDVKVSSVESQAQSLRLGFWIHCLTPESSRGSKIETFKTRPKVSEAQPMWHTSSWERPLDFRSLEMCAEKSGQTQQVMPAGTFSVLFMLHCQRAGSQEVAESHKVQM